MTDALSRGLPPVARADARVLVLGSLPGRASLAAAQYYGHPRNQFWWLMEGVTGRALVALAYPDRLAALADRGVALWDTVAAAVRPGSLDADMRDVQRTDLAGLVATLPRLRAVGFNGGTAWKLGSPQLAGRGLALIALPSSSPAHAGRTLAEKAALWDALRAWL